MDGIQIRVYCPECGAEVGMVLGRERIPEQLIRMFKIFNLPDPGGENAYKGETGCSCGKIVKATFVIEAFPEGERTKAVKLSYAEPETNNTEEKGMAKNSLHDLADHLFEQIEWLKDRDNIKGEDLLTEIKRTEAVVKASAQIVNIANTFVKAKALAGNSSGKIKLPAMLEDKTK